MSGVRAQALLSGIPVAPAEAAGSPTFCGPRQTRQGGKADERVQTMSPRLQGIHRSFGGLRNLLHKI